jgi:hypothetical protein
MTAAQMILLFCASPPRRGRGRRTACEGQTAGSSPNEIMMRNGLELVELLVQLYDQYDLTIVQ